MSHTGLQLGVAGSRDHSLTGGPLLRLLPQDGRDQPDFDWEGELWETLTHELQHHLESLADEDALEAMDYAVDESFKRERGEPFDPWYFQWGEPLDDGVYRVEDEVYIERVLTEEEFDGMEGIEFTWENQSYRCRGPRSWVTSTSSWWTGPSPTCRSSWSARVVAATASGGAPLRGPTVLESGAEARPL